MANLKPLLDRKDIAQMLGVSVYVVRANEVRWGLDKSKVELNPRLIRYESGSALKAISRITRT